jgi:hypothetical protein
MMICPKCEQPTMYMEDTLERCLCGWWNDILRPMRTKPRQKYYDALDRQEIKQEIDIIKAACPYSIRWFDKPRKSIDEQKVAKAKATAKWRKNNPKKIKAYHDVHNVRLRAEYKSTGAIKRVNSNMGMNNAPGGGQ